MKKEKGITLVALVITIVVLIILAGVTIGLTLNQNGIFTKAKQARENYLLAANEEQSMLANIDIDNLTGSASETNSLQNKIAQLQKEIEKGKSVIATAITNKGVKTESNASFETMATNIGNIASGKTVIDLGVGTSFNVSSYEGFENFTTSNFIVEPASAVSGGWGGTPNNNGASSVNATSKLVKSYSNGVLTAKLNIVVHYSQPANGQNYDSANNNANVHAYLIY